MRQRSLADCINTADLLILPGDTTVLEAARQMTTRRRGSVLVVDAAQRLIGIFTERDLMTKVVACAHNPAKVCLHEVMTRQPRSVAPHMPVSHALVLMRDGGFRHLPVVDAQDKPIGMFSMRDSLIHELVSAELMLNQQEALVISM